VFGYFDGQPVTLTKRVPNLFEKLPENLIKIRALAGQVLDQTWLCFGRSETCRKQRLLPKNLPR
jgi:hypothetical protein